MINEKNNFLTVSWLSGLLSAEIFISTGEWGVQMPPLTSENSYFLRPGPQGATLVMIKENMCLVSMAWCFIDVISRHQLLINASIISSTGIDVNASKGDTLLGCLTAIWFNSIVCGIIIRSRPKLNYGAGRDFEVGPEFRATRKQPIIPGNSRARSCADEEDRVT